MFADEREDLPREPEGGAPEQGVPQGEAPEGAPGEPGEGTPSETAPEPGKEPVPEAGGDAPPEVGEEPPAGGDEEPEAVGPEIEGVEELAGRPEGAVGPTPEQTARPETAPDETAPEQTAPHETGPDETARDQTAPDETAPDETAPEQTAPDETPPEAATPDADVAEAERERRRRRDKRGKAKSQEEVIPGAHLEPDLVLEEAPREESEFGQYAEVEEAYAEGEAGEEVAEEVPAEPQPVAHTPIDLAADARYGATGKRKSAIARVILKPGEGAYNVNGRHLDEYFPRVKLQRVARQPLEAAGYQTRMDVVARIHGGGVSAQAVALRHGVARALVEADPALRGELKRRGYLTRDPRVKERKKAGLKKARKRPQFSKR